MVIVLVLFGNYILFYVFTGETEMGEEPGQSSV